MELNIFTDGSTLNNQKKGNRCGGIGIFFGDNDKRNLSLSLKESKDLKVTNQVAELLACIYAIEKNINDIKNYDITICTDSMYVLNSMTKWALKWEKNNWINSKGKTVENLELIKNLFNYTNNYNIKYKHIRAHQKEPSKDNDNYHFWYGNHMADKLAVQASLSVK